jgi:hypothetical protein
MSVIIQRVNTLFLSFRVSTNAVTSENYATTYAARFHSYAPNRCGAFHRYCVPESYLGSNECFILIGMTPFMSAVQRGRIARKAA